MTARLAAGSRDELVLDQIRDAWGALYDTGFAGGALPCPPPHRGAAADSGHAGRAGIRDLG